MNCRINQQRVWACRIQLEAFYHPQSIFITLTYNDDTVPVTEDGQQNLSVEDIRAFNRRLKRRCRSIQPIRHFSVGEYGNKTERPHYHAVIFGLGLEHEPLIQRCWNTKKVKRGFTQVSELTPQRAAYIAQYTTKKMTKPGHHKLDGRHHEFIRTSREKLLGGIGGPAVPWLAAIHRQRKGRLELFKNGDVFKAVRIGGKIWPLGPYIRAKLRDALGIPQLARERALYFNNYDPETGELDELPPLPETYCPNEDIMDISSPWRKYGEKKARKEGLADLEQKAAHRARSRARRTFQTTRV